MAAHSTAMQPGAMADKPLIGHVFTLGVDIGGTNLKAAVLDEEASFLTDRIVQPTPRPATPDTLLEAIADIAASLPAFHRMSIGFPGVVKGGTVLTAPNLGTQHWAGCNLIMRLSDRFGVPVRMLNDAAVHGLGVVEGRGLECVITLGTGVGCALFRARRLLLHLEFGQLKCSGMTNDQFIGQAALNGIGLEAWNVRVRETVKTVLDLTCCDALYIGGGNARKIAVELPPEVKIVSNSVGLAGGVRLWDREFDEFFVDEAHARGHPAPEKSS